MCFPVIIVRLMLLPSWGLRRFNTLCKREQKRLIHDTTVADEMLVEAMLFRARRISRQVKREVRYIRYKILSPFGITVKG